MYRMHVHRAAGMRTRAVQPAMQPPGRGIGRVRTVQGFGIVRVDHDEITCADAGEMHLVGVDQELRALFVDAQAEVIGNRLVHALADGPAKGGSQIHPFLPVFHVGLQVRHAHVAFLSSVSTGRPATRAYPA
jgi:hypothetical protein